MQLFKSDPRYWLKNNNGPMKKQQLTMDPSPHTVHRSNERGSKELRDMLKTCISQLKQRIEE